MKKKLLFFTNSLYGGGAEKVLQTLLSNLDLEKYDITLYSVNEEILNDKYPLNITYQYIFKQIATNIFSRLWAKIYNKIKLLVYYNFSPQTFYRLFVCGKYDTEVAFIEGYSTRIVSGSTNNQSKKLAWVHTNLKNNHWTDIAYHSIEEEISCYKRFNSIINVSDSVRKCSIELFGDLNHITLYNPIDDKTILKLAQQKICLDFTTEATIKLISIGRLVNQKGYDRLLPIIKNIIDEGYDVTLTILGEGAERNKLEEYIANNNLQDKVFLLGFVENPYAIMAKHDIFICSSRAEGYSLVIAEAMILGLPIVSTYCSGPNELLNDGEYGVLTENSEKALSQGIKSLITSPSEKKKFKRLSMQRAKQLDFKSIMQKIEDVL